MDSILLKSEWMYGHTGNISVTGNRLYATCGNILHIYDISTPSSPQLLAEVKYAGLPQYGGWSAQMLTSNDKAAFVAQYKEGVVIVDRNLNSIRLKTENACGVACSQNRLYVANYSTLIEYDITDPLNPREIRRIARNSVGVYTDGNIICSINVYRILDIYDLAANLIYSQSFEPTTITDIAISSNYVFIATRNGEVKVLDLVSKNIYTYSCGVAASTAISLAGSYIIAAFHDYQVEVIDFSVISSPRRVAVYDYRRIIGGYPSDVQAFDKYFVLACHYKGFNIVDISSPANPFSIYTSPWYGRAQACVVSNDGRYIYLGDDMGFRVIDCTLAEPRSIAYLLTNSRNWHSMDIDRSRNLVFCPQTWGGLKIVDVSNPYNPVIILDYNPVEYIDVVRLIGNRLFIGHGNEVRIYDVSDPTKLVLIGSYDTGSSPSAIDVKGNYCFVDKDSSILVLDISNPSTITLKATIPQPYVVNQIRIVGDRLYSSVRSGHLSIVDISNPISPVVINNYQPNLGIAEGLALTPDGKYAYLGAGGTLAKIDVSNPYSPIIVEMDMRENGRDVLFIDIYGKYMAAAMGGEGVKLYEIEAPPIGKGILQCRALYDSTEVSASVEVVGVGTYTTPFSIELDPVTYHLKATYETQVLERDVTIESAKTTTIEFQFTAAPPPPPPTPVPINIGLIAVIAGITTAIAILLKELLKKRIISKR